MKIIEEFGFRGHHFAFGIHWLILRKCHLIFLSFRGLYFCALPIFSAGRVQRIEKNVCAKGYMEENRLRFGFEDETVWILGYLTFFTFKSIFYFIYIYILICIGVYLFYSVVLVSAVWHSESAITIHISPPPFLDFLPI